MDCAHYMALPFGFRCHSNHWEREDWISRLPCHSTDPQWSHGCAVAEPEQRQIDVKNCVTKSGLLRRIIEHAVEELADDFTANDVYELVKESGVTKPYCSLVVQETARDKGMKCVRTEGQHWQNLWRRK